MTRQILVSELGSLTRVDEPIAVLHRGHHPPGMSLTHYADGVLHLVVDDGLMLDVERAAESRRQMAAVGGRAFVVVGDLSGVPFVDREARAFLADDEDGRILATAVITGREGPIALLVERWLADNTILRPVAAFEETAPALAWAHAKAAELRAAGRF